jgi:hypothetical protein
MSHLPGQSLKPFLSRLRVLPLRAKLPFGTSHLALLLILILFTAMTLYQSIILPLGEADDETDHYQYLRFVARTGHPPFTEAERQEAGFKGGLAPLYYWLTAWPIALVGTETRPEVRRVDARPERHIPTDGLGLNRVLHTLDEQWPWRGQILAWHLVRFLSLPMAWVTIMATYFLARRLWPDPKIIALGAAAFVAFLPRFVSSSAVINDDNLVFALTVLLLWVQVIILQSAWPSPRLFALFGALFGLTLLTKYFSLILIPEVIFTLILAQVASSRAAKAQPQNQKRPKTEDGGFTFEKPRPTPHAPRLLAFLTALALAAGPWFVFILMRFNRVAELGFIPGLAASLGEPQITEGLVGLLSGPSVRPVAATYTLAEWFGLLYRSFWFEFGWMQLFAPGWIYGLFTLFLLCALFGHSWHLITDLSSTPQHAFRATSPIFWLLSLHFALFLMVVLARYILSATIDTGQGRHLFPALPIIALFISVGLIHFGGWAARLGLNFGFKIFPRLAIHIVPAILRILPAPHRLQFSIYYLLFTIFFLFPSLSLQPSVFILPHYFTLPVTIIPPTDLPISYRHTLAFADGLALAGFDAPSTVSAGDTLPVTLYWQANQEAGQDYLLSLCLQDDNRRPVACWRGPFADGRYPARAWEVGDTLADAVFIPIPTCYRLPDQAYRLHLELWPLDPNSPEPTISKPPVLQHTFAEPFISIKATDSRLKNLPQSVDIWRGSRRLTGPTSLSLADTVTRLDYAGSGQDQPPGFIHQGADALHAWLPLMKSSTPLYLPCDNGPAPFAQLATFVASPMLLPGQYLPNPADATTDLRLTLNLRQRTFAPISSTPVFTPSLALLSLEIPGQPGLDFSTDWANEGTIENSNLPTLQPSQPLLPLTIRWQAHRWMADPLIVSLKLLDKDFKVGGERLATLGDRYSNVLWTPTEIVEETYPLRLDPVAPPGLYRLEVSLLRQDNTLPDGYEYLPLTDGQTTPGHNLYPATFRLLDPADGTPPPYPLNAQLGDAIHLAGYDISPQSTIHQSEPKAPYGQFTISFALYWQSTAKIPADYTVFTQLLGPDGQVWAQWDNPPQAGRYPTTAWAAQDSIVDRYNLTLRNGAPPGQYRLLVGMYDPSTGQRLPVTINDQPQPDNAIELTILTVDY